MAHKGDGGVLLSELSIVDNKTRIPVKYFSRRVHHLTIQRLLYS
ncbi:hypothetical protein HNR53_004279 [Bacillus benzoevorans]|uniref:Uncharacterized protein n=1 Tax=Bacillus benzoevorans TaxID=1456 RepID=A0A7X0HVG9_9BACI|nr:hypothetical protein [Bacillus benzoevorans]